MIAAGPLLILCVIAALVCGAHAYRAVAGHMLRMSSSSTVSPVITRIDDDADVYRAAQLSIGVFFPEEASKIGGMKFKNPLKENMYKKLFRQHLQELNGRVSKPNCILLKATDGESEDVLGFVEMFMAACIVEEDDDYAGESAGENKDQGVESDVNAHLDNINTDLTTGTHSLNDKNKNKDIVSFASPKEVNSARASSRTIVYLPKIANLAVSPRARRTGLGTKLVNQCMEIAGQWGHTQCVLQVEEPNTTAREFYKALGFQTMGLERGKTWDTNGWQLRQVDGKKVLMRKFID